MSGHSHWATIKGAKGKADAKRGQLFSKLSKDIMVAAKNGIDPETNSMLKVAMDRAKEANMPKSSVEKIIKKVSGEGIGSLEDLMYEGYGPGGTAILAQVITDNRNRTASELRKIFDNSGGKMGEAGCVGFLFEKKSVFTVSVSSTTEDKLMELLLDIGVDDISKQDEFFEILAAPLLFNDVRIALEKANIPVVNASLSQIPKNMINVDEEKGIKVLNLISRLEDHDDVQNVYCNYDPPKEVVEKFESQH